MSVDVNRLRAEGLYETREPVETLAADLDQIQALATGWHQSRNRRALWATILFAVGVVLFAVGLWYVGILLWAMGGWLLYAMKQFPKAVANHLERCAFGKSVAAMLAADSDPKTPVAMRLLFNAKEETISEGVLRGYKNGKQRIHKEAWFSVEAHLHDGTTFSETVDDLVRRRSFTNARGKSKVKTRSQNLIGMRFDYPAETYGDVTPLRPRMEKEIQLPQSVVLRGLEVSGKAVKVKAVATQGGNASYLAQASSMAALGVYRILNLSREVEARKRAQAKRGGPK